MNENKPRENEVEAWGFGINDFDAMKHVEDIKAARGFIGVNLSHPQGTLLLFKTENDAKICRNIAEHAGCRVGKQVVSIFVDKQYINVEVVE